MKRILTLLLCVCALSVSALAVDPADYMVTLENGETYLDEYSYNAAVAAEKVAAAGLSLDVSSYWVTDWLGNTFFDNAAFEADYAAALEAMQEPEESEDTADEITDTAVPEQSANDIASDDKYPVGSYIDEMGNVFSSEGELLSAGTEAPSYLDSVTPVLDEEPNASDGAMVSYEEPEPHVYDVVDLRSDSSAVFASDDTAYGSDPTGIVSGLKALIVSIFGEYTPVTTTATVMETVDNVTTTTLIDAVAEGAAGVDYEWIAGVFLFGLLLFCLMKLLGGILK